MRKRTSNNLNQEPLPLEWQALDDWPEHYHKKIDPILTGSFFDPIFGFDIETEGIAPYDKRCRIISIGVSPESGMSFVTYTLDPKNWDIESLKTLEAILTNPNAIVVGHNIKFDINWIRVKFGIDVRCMLFDTQYALYLLDENRFEAGSGKKNDLGSVSAEFIPGWEDHKLNVNRNNLKMMAKDDELLYNGRDADASRRLFDVFIPRLKKQGLLPINNTAMEVLPVLSKMETTGVYLDKEWANKHKFKLFENAIQARMEINHLSKMAVDPDSSQSMQNLLYKRMGMPVEVVTAKGQPAVNKEAIHKALERVKKGGRYERILRLALNYKKGIKLLSTYYQPIPRWTAFDGRVHTNYRLGKQDSVEGFGGTVTGRLSSDSPNLQNIPIGPATRGMFAATPGWVIFDGDYSQLELRVAAYLSQEPVMMQAFEEGLDIHSAVMADLMRIPYDEIQERKESDLKVERVAIKRINFGIVYGVQAARLQKLLWLELGIYWELERCEQLIKDWLDRYARLAKWLASTKRFAVDFGFVRMPFGQIRRLPQADFRTGEGRRALRQATNFPVQSTASWICLIGMVLLDRWIVSNNLKARLLMQVHDSISLEISEDQATRPAKLASKISRIMERDVKEYIKEFFDVDFNVPLKFEVKWGERWK